LCDEGYVVVLRRADGKPITDHETQTLLHSLALACAGLLS
jgi:hypothetical protein